MKCIKCGAERLLHRHHVTYEPEQIVIFCQRCHRVITNINTMVARNHNMQKKLSNEQRIELHQFFMDNELWIVESITPQWLLVGDKAKSVREQLEPKEKKLKKRKPKKKKRKWNGPKKSKVVSGPPSHYE